METQANFGLLDDGLNIFFVKTNNLLGGSSYVDRTWFSLE